MFFIVVIGILQIPELFIPFRFKRTDVAVSPKSEGMTLHRQADSAQRILTEVLNKRKLSRIQKKLYKKDY
jgi:hypothetical protein